MDDTSGDHLMTARNVGTITVTVTVQNAIPTSESNALPTTNTYTKNITITANGMGIEDFLGKTNVNLQKTETACLTTQSFFDRVIAEGRQITETYTDVRPDGRVDYYHVNAFPLRDNDRKISRLILTRRNTTEEMQIEQRLYQSQKMAAIGELSTYLAHEIRNPLFAIGGFANALLRIPSLDEPAREKARIILEESQRLDDILKSIINNTDVSVKAHVDTLAEYKDYLWSNKDIDPQEIRSMRESIFATMPLPQ